MPIEINSGYNIEITRLNQELLEYIHSHPGADLRNKFNDYNKRLEALNEPHANTNAPSNDNSNGAEQLNKDPTLPLISSIQLELNALHFDQRPSPELNNEPNKTHISWNEYFMSVAQLAARRSKDPATQVGACIVNEQNKIVATGYNGMPNGVCDDIVPWRKTGPFLETKYAYVVHAELNAILNCVLTDQTCCRIYVSLFPCNECAKAIIQSGIRHVIYLSDKHKDKDSTKAAKIMFQMARVLCEVYGN